jgi:hypothetical protein
MHPPLHAFHRAGMCGDAPGISVGQEQPRTAKRTDGQDCGPRRGARARRDQRFPDVRRNEGASLKHASDPDEYSRKSRPSGDAAIGPAAFRRLIVSPSSCLLKSPLRTDVTRIERAGNGGILRSFDDRTPVGEHSHFVGCHAELQKKLIIANF